MSLKTLKRRVLQCLHQGWQGAITRIIRKHYVPERISDFSLREKCSHVLDRWKDSLGSFHIIPTHYKCWFPPISCRDKSQLLPYLRQILWVHYSPVHGSVKKKMAGRMICTLKFIKYHNFHVKSCPSQAKRLHNSFTRRASSENSLTSTVV